MTEAILWLVLWLVFAFVGAWAIVALATLLFGAIAVGTDQVWIGVVGAVLAWLGGIAWFIFAAVQFALQIASIVGIATAG